MEMTVHGEYSLKEVLRWIGGALVAAVISAFAVIYLRSIASSCATRMKVASTLLARKIISYGSNRTKHQFDGLLTAY